MATPVINNLMLPIGTILVLPDEGDKPTTGVISRRSPEGGGHFRSSIGDLGPTVESNHILFVCEMATEVQIDNVIYLAMHECAVVGLIP